jgi:hypothetical protein
LAFEIAKHDGFPVAKGQERDGFPKRLSINLAREIDAGGKCRCFIEGQPPPLATLPPLQKLPRDAFQKCRQRATPRIDSEAW